MLNKFNLRWIIDLNIKSITMKLLKKNIGKYFCDLVQSSFLRQGLKSIPLKKKMDKSDFLFLLIEDTIKIM